MQKHLRSLACGLVFLSLTAPAYAQDSAEITADTVLATVNGQDITLGHVIAARATLPEQYNQLSAEQLYDGILLQLIQQTALAQSVETLPPQVAFTLENEERSLRAGEAVERGLEGAVTEEDVVAAYEESISDFESQEEYNASHILVETEEEAIAVRAELDGGADFATTAREKSTGPSGPNGGELGWFGTGMMVPSFEAAVIALETGEISDPVETQFGWHVIKLNETRQNMPPSLEESREGILRDLRTDVASAIITEAGENADVSRTEVEGMGPEFVNRLDLIGAE